MVGLNTTTEMCAIQLRPESLTGLVLGTSMLINDDVTEMEVKIKSMDLVAQAEASMCFMLLKPLMTCFNLVVLALQAEVLVGAEMTRLYQLAYSKFEEAIAMNSNNPVSYYHWALMLHSMVQKKLFRGVLKTTQISLVNRTRVSRTSASPHHCEMRGSYQN